jgi:hypothetical protein
MSSLVGDILGIKQRVSMGAVDISSEFIEFDASVSETHTGNAEVTAHPVEDGSEMNDHVRRAPEELQINLIVTDDPIVILRSIRAKPAVQGGDPRSRAVEAYFLLRKWKNEGRLLTVNTTLRSYINMVIIAFAVTRDKDTGRMLNANLTVKEIITVTTQTAELAEPVDVQKGNKVNQGNKPKTEAAAGSATEKKSGGLFVSLADAVPTI